MRRRLAAAVALLVGLATIVLGVVVAVNQFPRGLGLLACVVIAAVAAWYGVLRRGTAHVPTRRSSDLVGPRRRDRDSEDGIP